TVVTLLLTPDQAQRAVLASTQGAIHFVLRNGGDGSLSAEAPVRLSQLAGRPAALQTTTPKPAKPPAKPREIETILAGGVAGGVAEVRSTAAGNGGAGL
ncbi:MAG TPA: hypothetical protein VGU23_08520, partial [Acidobacteriaceae bacterium]|nr:hypothetical protein [Acidobacteriaceae bacterium]